MDSDKAHSELLRTVFKTSRISKMTRLDSDHMCTGRPCKVSHFKQSSEKFILHYKCSHNMKFWHEKNLYRCWQFNSWIANTYTFDKYLYMLVVLLVLARCWQINWPHIGIQSNFGGLELSLDGFTNINADGSRISFSVILQIVLFAQLRNFSQKFLG